jgi:hypothetical protein
MAWHEYDCGVAGGFPHDSSVCGKASQCPDCGSPYALQMKFNSGDPMEIEFPTCTCEEEKMEEEIDAFLERRAHKSGGTSS